MSLKSLSQINLGQYTLPTSDGSNGQVLQTNGSGTVAFATIPNKFLSGLSFNTSTGVLTATVSGGSNVTVDLDNRYLELGGGILTGDLYLALSGSNQRALSSTGTNSMQIGDAGVQNLKFKNAAGNAFQIAASGDATFAGQLTMPGYIKHTGDADTKIGFNTDNTIELRCGGNLQINADASRSYLRYQGTTKLYTDSTGIYAFGSRSIFAADTIVNSFSGTAGVEVYKNAGDSVLMIHQDDGNHESKLHFRTGGNDTQIIVPASTYALQIDTETTADAFVLSLAGTATFAEGLAAETLTLSGGSGGIPAYVRSSGTVSYIQIQNSATQYGGSSNGFTVGNNDVHAYVWNRETASLYLGTADTTALHLDSSQRAIFAQNVSVPQTKKILFDGISGHTYLAEESDSNLKVYVGGTERFNFSGGTNHSQQTLQGNSSIVQNDSGASRTITLSSGSDIRGSNHLLVQADASYLKLAASNNNIYYDTGTHYFRNGAGTTNYVTVSATDTTIAKNTTIGALTSGQTATLTVNHEGGVPSVARFKSRTNKAHIEISDNDTTGYISSENGFFSIGRNAGVNAAHININASNQVLIGATSTSFNDKLYVVGDAYITGAWRVGTTATFVGKLVNDSGKLSLMSDGNRDVQIGSNNTPNILEIDTSAEDSTFSGHLAITGSTLQTYQQFNSDPISSSDANNLFSIGGHGMAGGYSRNVSIFSTTVGVWRSWVGTNLRWDGTNYKRATNQGNNNWGNVAGIEFKGGSGATDKTITFYVDAPESATSGTVDSTVGTAIPSDWRALQIDNDRKIYGFGNVYIAGFSYFGSAYYSQTNTSYYVDPDGTSQMNNITVTGDITSGTGDNIYIGGSTNGIRLLHDGSNALFINQTTGDFKIQNSATDKDIIFRGNDGGSTINALTLDMSEGGFATFSGDIRLPSSGKLYLWTGHNSNFLQYNLWHASASGGMFIKNIASGGDIYFQTNSTTALTLDSSQNATFAGNISNASGHFTVSSADDFVVDAVGQINLDADGGTIRLKDGGSTFGTFVNSSQDFQIWAATNDKDLVFKGYDDGSQITALTLDMSDAGKASFSGAIHGPSSAIIIDSISGPYGRIHGTSSIFLGGGSTSNVQLSAALIPDADSARSLGSSSRYWSHTYTDAVTTTGDVNVGGNLNVTGDINSVSVTDLDVTDKTITVGKGQNAASSGSSGLVVDRSDSSNPSLLWNQGTSRFDFNTGLTVTGQVHTTGSVYAKGSLFVVDTDGTNNHVQVRSNGTEGFITVSNGSNWGLIMRGVVNNPRIGAYHGGVLKIEGFHSSDGGTGSNAVDLAEFDFANERFLVNGDVRINNYTGANTGGGGQTTYAAGLSIFENSGAAALFLGVKNASYANRGWSFKATEVGVNSKLELVEHGLSGTRLTIASGGDASFVGVVSVPTGKAFRMYNAAGSGWGEISLEESENKVQFNRGIKPSGNLQSDQTSGTSTKRWHTLYAGTGNFSSHVKTPYITSNNTNQSLFIYANGSGHVYFGDSGNGSNLYHYSTDNDGKYTTYDWNNNYYRIATSATNGIWLNDDLKTGNVTATSFIKSGGTSSQYLMADGSVSTGGGSADNLGNHTATQALNMAGSNITNAGSVQVGGELDFINNGDKYMDVFTLANGNTFNIRHHNPTGNVFETAFKTKANAETELYHNGSVSIKTRSDGFQAKAFMDSDNTARFINPAGSHAASLAGRVDISTTSDVKMRFYTPSTDSSDWGYIEFYKRDGTRATYFGINGSGNPTWAVNDGGPYIQLNDSGDYVEVGATNLRASSFVDKDSTAYYGDFGNTGTSVNVAGSINLLDNKMLLWGGNSIVKHTGSATEIGDNSSGSVLTLASGDADFTGNVEMQSGNSVGKFAVMSSAPHGSFDFYNNGTSYFNGQVTIDATCLFSDNEQLKFGGSADFLIYHNSTTNVNHVSSQLDRQLSINANIIQLTNQANSSTYLKLESSKATLNTGLNIGGSIGQRIYAKNYGSLDTTGQAVAGLLSGANGNSASFVFETAGGGSGGYQRVVFSCINVSGTWSVSEDINEGGDRFDITSSGNGSTVTFTFKARSSTQNYSPKVNIKAFGHSINETYF